MALFFLAEPAETDAELDGVDAGVGLGHASVGDVLEANFGADVVFGLEEVKAERSASGEVDLGSAGRGFFVGEESAATDFEVGRDFFGRRENPFEGEGVDAASACGAVGLGDAIDGQDAKRVFEAALEEPGAMRRGEDETEADAEVGYAVVHLTAVDTVAAAGEDLIFGFPFHWAGLGAGGVGGEKGSCEDRCRER